MARMQAFIPGESPPDVSTAIVRMVPLSAPATAEFSRSGCRFELSVDHAGRERRRGASPGRIRDTTIISGAVPPGSFVRWISGRVRARTCVERAVEVAGREDVHYTLLRVLAATTSPAHAVLPRRGEAPSTRAQRATVQDLLEAAADDLRARGLTVDTRIAVNDSTAQGILDYAEDWGADLVAMATRSRGGLERFLLGSVADRVLWKAETALLLWNPGQPSTRDLVEAFSFLGTRAPTRPWRGSEGSLRGSDGVSPEVRCDQRP